jgi:predicted flap endonuclease-1-like 5' DNA nuclease
MVTGWLWWLVLGVLLGWLVEWAVDWWYWRGRIEPYVTEIETLRAQSGSLSAERDRALASSRRCGGDLEALRAAHLSLSAERDGFAAELEGLRAGQATLAAERDGFAAELEGLRARAELADTEPKATLSAESEDGLPGLRLRLAELLGLGRLSGQQGLAAQGDAGTWDASDMIADGDIQLDFDGELTNRVATIKDSRAKIAAERDALEAEVLILRNRLAGQEGSLDRAQSLAFLGQSSVRPDRLVDIVGIGPVFERRLNQAGVTTFDQLSRLSQDDIQRIIQPEEWQQIDANSWIAEAQEFVQRGAGRSTRGDRLIDILGIGPVYERRLNEAGVFTFAQLYALSPEAILEIIKPEAWQNVDAESWIAQARAMDTDQRKEAGA